MSVQTDQSKSVKASPTRKQIILVTACLIGILTLCLSSGCTALVDFLPRPSPTAPIILPIESAQQVTTLPDTTAPSPTPTPALQTITLWVPPQFDPSGSDAAAQLLQSRLAEFSRQYPAYTVKVRIKATSGPASLLNSLSAASAAAPLAVPSLILLTRSDLEAAAVKGLIFPMDQQQAAIDEADWFNYARQLSLIQGSSFGLPFAGDVLLLVYRPGKVNPPGDGWPGILRQGRPMAFPAGDPQAMLTLNLYLSLGGQITDPQGRPILQPELLAKVYQLYADGALQGVIPGWLASYSTDDAAWEAYRQQSADWLITWSSRYLREMPADSAALPLPALGDQPVNLSTGWVWALSDLIPERRPAAIQLAEFLTSGDFLARWTVSAGALPVRPSSLEAWPNQSVRTLLSPIITVARPKPANDVLTSLGPILSDGSLQVIKRQSDPLTAAQSAAERLTISSSNK